MLMLLFRELYTIKVKGRDIYIPPLTGKPWPAAVYNAKWRTDHWPAMTLGGAAQVAAAHCPNERTPQSAARQTYLSMLPCQPHYGLHPAMFSGKYSLFLVASITGY